MPEVSGDLITRNYSNFRGVDFSNTEVALYRSPDAINMWKDYKKMGTSIETRPDIVLFKELKNTVYGLFFYTINQVDHMIIHCGVSLYDYNMKTKELKIIKEKGMNIRKSQSFIYRNILYIKDGLNYLQYDGETCKEVIGYIPTTTIGKAPSGGGTTNQEVNLLTGVRENSFCADGESTEYVLDASELDAGYQEKVFINNVEKTEGFTVDKVSGKVNFTTAPEKPLTDGQDNVVIRFSKTIPGNRDKINKCTILEVFDNRVFFSGNQDYPNTVFHTMLDEPKYCSDLDYYNEGADISPVRGMVAGNNALWVIKEPSQANTAIFYHNPTIDSEAGKVYPSEHSSISTGCIGAAINFNDDIVYFSNRGMEGISGDITTEQVISHRSSLVDSKLLQEENYKDMILVEYEGYLLVIIKDKIYLADSRAMFTNENHNEYEWFYWNIDIEPTCAVVYNGELWLGSKQGIFKIGKASENNKEISMEKDEEERYFIDGVTKQETGAESYKTATGKEILIEDGENNKGLEIKVKGSTTQATRSGKNKFDLAKVNTSNIVVLNNTGFNLVNAWATQIINNTNLIQMLKPSTTYTCYSKAKVKDRPSYTSTSNHNTVLLLYKSGYETRQLSIIDKTLDTEQISVKTFTTPDDLDGWSMLGYSFYGNNDGSTTHKGIGEIEVKDLMIVEGTYTEETLPPYEQYGVMPSPDYPSPIENVAGKNKLDYKTVSNTPNTVVSLIENGFNVKGMYAGKVIVDNLKKNTNYYLQYLTENISGTLKQVSIFAGDTQTNTLKLFSNSIGGIFNTGENTKINIWFYVNNKPTTTGEANFTNIQLEEGPVATPYVPYNSLEFKVEGKNIFDCANSRIIYNNSNTSYERLDNGLKLISGGGQYGMIYFLVDTVKNLKDKTLTLSSDISFSKEKQHVDFGLYYTDFNGGNRKSFGIIKNIKTEGYYTIKGIVEEGENRDYVCIGLRPNMDSNFASGDYTIYDNLQVEIGETATPYEPYKSQTAYFPLSEGQKLMEGSYLADDGIHNVRRQMILDGTENWVNYAETPDGRYYCTIKHFGRTASFENPSTFKCSHFIGATSTIVVNGIASTKYAIYVNMSPDIAADLSAFKTWLSNNNVTVEYELEEEEIIPYTAEQQEAWDKIESMKLYDEVNHIESTSEIDIKYNYIYKKPSIKNKSDIENKISSGEYQTIINNKRYFVFLEEELKSVRNDITDRLYIDTNKNIAKVMKRVDKLVLNGTEEWNVNATHSNVFYTAKPKNMADNETNIFCTITDEFSKDLSGETYGILIDTNINIKIPKVKTVADLKAYLAKEPITIQYKATEEIKDIILLSKPSSYWTTCEDEFKYPQMQKTTNKRGCVADVIGEEIDVFCKTNKEQFEKIATHKNATGYAVNRIKKKKWKSIQLKFSSNKSFELFSCTLESYIGSYIKR